MFTLWYFVCKALKNIDQRWQHLQWNKRKVGGENSITMVVNNVILNNIVLPNQTDAKIYNWFPEIIEIHVHLVEVYGILMVQCKTVVTPLVMHWSYCSLALSHRFMLIFLLRYGRYSQILFQHSLISYNISYSTIIMVSMNQILNSQKASHGLNSWM